MENEQFQKNRRGYFRNPYNVLQKLINEIIKREKKKKN
jgi:hypothetical protein